MASQKRPSNLFTGTLPYYVKGAARGVTCIQCTKSALRGPLAPACHDTAGRSARCHRCCTNHLSCFPHSDEAIPLVRKLRSELHRKGEADSDVIKFREVLTTLLKADAELKAAAVTETETQLAKARTAARIAGESLVKATLTKPPTTTLGPKKNSNASSPIKSSKLSEVSRERRAPTPQGPRNKNQARVPQINAQITNHTLAAINKIVGWETEASRDTEMIVHQSAMRENIELVPLVKNIVLEIDTEVYIAILAIVDAIEADRDVAIVARSIVDLPTKKAIKKAATDHQKKIEAKLAPDVETITDHHKVEEAEVNHHVEIPDTSERKTLIVENELTKKRQETLMIQTLSMLPSSSVIIASES
ncbi:hypothetical protein HYALB_00005078 [Hymenoscyphus albidus]|uniref:Uncharacterized protein n=1 Tax=Hymenoscyphus albidus TaxID=595503 RepID=A0A9N9LQ60_9HELO|nr:hypothetical protein HYALB_00005078 [Hymenoscyphus albidus]